MRRLLPTLAATAVCLLAAASPATAFEVRATASDNGKTVHLTRGDVLQVTLAENAGTGYAWRLTRRPAASILRQLSNRFVAPPQTNPPTVGAPGRRVVRWRATNRGATSLRLQLFPPGFNTRPTQSFRLAAVVH